MVCSGTAPVITRQLALPDTCLPQKKRLQFLFCLLPKKPKEEWKEGGLWEQPGWGAGSRDGYGAGSSFTCSAGFGDPPLAGSSPPGSGGALQPRHVPVVSRAHPRDGGISRLCSRSGWWAHLAPFTFCKPLDARAQASDEPCRSLLVLVSPHGAGRQKH